MSPLQLFAKPSSDEKTYPDEKCLETSGLHIGGKTTRSWSPVWRYLSLASMMLFVGSLMVALPQTGTWKRSRVPSCQIPTPQIPMNTAAWTLSGWSGYNCGETNSVQASGFFEQTCQSPSAAMKSLAYDGVNNFRVYLFSDENCKDTVTTFLNTPCSTIDTPAKSYNITSKVQN